MRVSRAFVTVVAIGYVITAASCVILRVRVAYETTGTHSVYDANYTVNGKKDGDFSS